MWRRFTPTVKDLFMSTSVPPNHSLGWHWTTRPRILESLILSFTLGPQNKSVPIQNSRRQWGNARYTDINANRIPDGRTELKTIFRNWIVDGSGAWSSVETLNVYGIWVWYTNPRLCLYYHVDMTVESAWRESQETQWTIVNRRTLSSMTYVGIGIHPMTGKTRSLEDSLVFPTT